MVDSKICSTQAENYQLPTQDNPQAFFGAFWKLFSLCYCTERSMYLHMDDTLVTTHFLTFKWTKETFHNSSPVPVLSLCILAFSVDLQPALRCNTSIFWMREWIRIPNVNLILVLFLTEVLIQHWSSHKICHFVVN